MKFIINTGKYIFATTLAAFAIIQFITAALPSALMPLPKEMPGKVVIAYVSGLIFLLTAIAVFINRKAALMAMVSGFVFLLFLIYPHTPKLISNVYNAGEWVVFLEILALACGCFILANSVTAGSAGIRNAGLIARYLFAVVLLIFGIQHVMYENFILTLIPAWMLVKLLLARMVTTAFFATALSIGLNLFTRLSTTLTGFMFVIFVATLHAPRVFLRPTKETEWTSLSIALAAAGICFMIAAGSRRRGSKV